MKNEKFRDALDHIDYSFIEEYVEEKERLQKENRRKRLLKTAAPLAATFIVFFTVLGIVLGGNALPMSPAPGDDFTGSMSYENIYVFEYGGKRYCAAFMNLSFNFGDKYLGDELGEIEATDNKGNTSSHKIFSSSLDTVDKEVFIEINGNYYPAYKSNKK